MRFENALDENESKSSCRVGSVVFDLNYCSFVASGYRSRRDSLFNKDRLKKYLIHIQSVPSGESAKSEGPEGGVAELVDLEQELCSLRRGLTQVEGLTPSTDPFGDSFIVPAQVSFTCFVFIYSKYMEIRGI